MARTIQVNEPSKCVRIDGKKFSSNSVKTARFTYYDFLPKQFFLQFSKFANLYFAFISVLQAVPGWSPTGRFTTIVPLSIFVLLSMAREAYDDYYRHKSDAAENNTTTFATIFNISKRFSMGPATPNWRASISRPHGEQVLPANDIKAEWATVQWKSLNVGDVVKIHDKEFIPADLIILRTEKSDGVCYIETANLDGETNYKMRQAPTLTSDFIVDEFQLTRLNATVSAEPPNGNLYQFNGSLDLKRGDHTTSVPLTVNQMALRGSTLANSGYIIGVVVYTGEESKIRVNANDSHRSKTPLMERFTNKIVLVLFAVVLLFAAFNTIASYIWESTVNQFGTFFWYLKGLGPDYVATYFSYVILYNALIPISLYVTLEMVKLAQIYFINHDLLMYDRKSNRFAEAKTSSINEDLGQIQYVFSDKTGTLTENVMIFRKFSVMGTPFSLIKDPSVQSSLYSKDDFIVQDFLTDFKRLSLGSEGLATGELFLQAVALCHQCQIEKSEGAINYQSSSPDEVALVAGAREMKCTFASRLANKVVIEFEGQKHTYTMLATIEFTSSRKRMSVVYSCPDGRLIMFTKGADNVIIQRLAESSKNSSVFATTLSNVDRFSREGLRTLLYAYKVISAEQFNAWKIKFDEASLALADRDELIDAAATEIENELILLGATAIEDKLQAEVPETIDKLRRAGIRLWMLTGDKKETAINIGNVCSIIKPTSTLLVVDGEDIQKIKDSLDTSIAKLKELKGPKEIGQENHVVSLVEGDVFTVIQTQHSNSSEGIKNPTSEISLLLRFLEMAVTCDNVICCRFSPSQKSVIVSRIKTLLNESRDGTVGLFSTSTPPVTLYERFIYQISMKKVSGLTLAIGDGANDIPMMESAHVGIGITGREGLAAARASDYAIAQFRFLQPLLFVHGRYNYQRIAVFTLGTFYKSLAFYICQLYYQIWTGWSGTSLFEQWTLALYNILFSSLPVLAVGMFEKDLNISTLLNIPELYRSGQVNLYYNVPVFMRWMVQGFWHAACASIITVVAYDGLGLKNKFLADSSGPSSDSSLIPLGTIAYSAVVVITVAKIGFIESHNWTGFTFAFAGVTLGVWWLYQIIYDNLYPALLDFGYDSTGMFYSLAYSQGALWMIVIISSSVAVICCDFVLKSIQCFWSPWKGYRLDLQRRPFNRQMLDKQEGNDESYSSEFAIASAFAARVAKEFDGDWTRAAPWFQEWERFHGIGSTMGLKDLINVCPEAAAPTATEMMETTRNESESKV